MKYSTKGIKKSHNKAYYVLIILVVALVAAAAGSFATRTWYQAQLQPASASERVEVVEITEGSTVQEIATTLQEKQLIRSSQAFLWYVRTNSLLDDLKAGVYQIDASLSTPEIIKLLTEGKVVENSVTILPGKRLDQISTSLQEDGFTAEAIAAALDPANYKGHPALIAKPSNLSLEGYLFPETFSATKTTTVDEIITKSLDEMAEVMNPEVVTAWQNNGLSIHQAVTLASIVEQEVKEKEERRTVAGVFYNRLAAGMPLGSDPTYKYAGFLLNKPPSAALDSSYNTYKIIGLPPGPIGTVSKSSLEAVAYPTEHDYLYFVSGDDGITRFSKTLAEHEALTKQYCIELCKSY